MDLVRREQLPQQDLLGRSIWKAFGEKAVFPDNVSGGFARFSLQHGKMKAHRHERELILVLDAQGAAVRYGPSPEGMGEAVALQKGDFLRMQEGEWHIFDLADENSYLDILWFFGVAANHTEDADL
ncbi:MAG: hypothetical protein E7442_03310 [Ruminococcaceae bacterium]|nr:hypothetical protein [Oscillospiraceae bacterium]